MEKENKIVFITKTCLDQKKTDKFKEKYDFCYNEKMDINKTEKKIKKATTILIYDITYKKEEEEGKFFSIKDHINKTGKNLLIKQNKTPTFVDISRLYRTNKKGIITTGLGEYYKKFYKKIKNPSSDLCLISVWCKSLNPNLKIEGKLLNIF